MDGLIYSYNNTARTAEVIGYCGPGGKVVIPASTVSNGVTYSVTSIGNAAFTSLTNLTDIQIANSVTNISSQAFRYCSGLKSISMGTGLKSIGSEAFWGCENLTTLVVPNNVTNIAYQAFWHCTGLTNVTLGMNLKNIADDAFWGCTSLTDIIIPNNVTNVGEQAFYSCGSLTNVVIGYGVKTIGTFAFLLCDNLEDVYFYGDPPLCDLQPFPFAIAEGHYAWQHEEQWWDVIENNMWKGLFMEGRPGGDDGGGNNGSSADYIFEYDDETATAIVIGYIGTGGDIVIPSNTVFNKQLYSVTGIGDDAFYWQENLTSVGIPHSITNIGSSAFADCSNMTNILFGANVATIGYGAFNSCYGLTNMVFPASVMSIGNGMFTSCYSLTNLTVEVENSIYASLDGVLFNKDKTELLIYPPGRIGAYIIPDSVRRIGDYAFWICFDLTDIIIPFGVEDIGETAFEYCYSLTNMVIPRSVTNIGPWAFSSCPSLTNVVIGSGVQTIGDAAFYWAAGLEKVVWHGGPPPSHGEEVFADIMDTAKGYYWSTYRGQWQAVMVDGQWQGLKMYEMADDITQHDVPFSWLDDFQLVQNGDYESAATNLTVNNVPAWQAFVAGTDPTKTGEVFAVTGIWPDLTWNPDLGTARNYTIYGSTNLTNPDGWYETDFKNDTSSRYFRVKVNLNP